ncbi:hypothetical protein B0T20DRAFT_392465 [Sordaria brevicollis]|uniref:Uncharacterized protein n=1 Tax=Sordaria brevicollis TaxID=83679 RepID=A0AAE0PGK2_SORBR|nr:hypothetical protein B0T20DRAFT_392465 [Sordaria brevicollis]
MCILSYIPSPFAQQQQVLGQQTCYLTSLKFCAHIIDLHPAILDIRGLTQPAPSFPASSAAPEPPSRIATFGRNTSRIVISNNILFAQANCPYFDHAEVEGRVSATWWNFTGSQEVFVMNDLPAPRARWTHSAGWVAERLREAEERMEAREREQQERAARQDVADNAVPGDDGIVGGEQVAAPAAAPVDGEHHWAEDAFPADNGNEDELGAGEHLAALAEVYGVELQGLGTAASPIDVDMESEADEQAAAPALAHGFGTADSPIELDSEGSEDEAGEQAATELEYRAEEVSPADNGNRGEQVAALDDVDMEGNGAGEQTAAERESNTGPGTLTLRTPPRRSSPVVEEGGNEEEVERGPNRWSPRPRYQWTNGFCR